MTPAMKPTFLGRMARSITTRRFGGFVRGRLRHPVEVALAFTLILVLGLVAFIEFGPAVAEGGDVAGKPVPAGDLATNTTAALSCPALTGPKLAAQVMAASGFDAYASGVGGRQGLGGLDAAAWDKWAPWPGAQRTDRRANILALAHQTCELVGQVRAADVLGDAWQAAVAATRVGIDAVKAARAVPASASSYVDTVVSLAAWYAKQSDFGGPNTPSAAPNALAKNAPGGAKAVPDEYVSLVAAAGKICDAVTPAKVAAQLMAASAFNPSLQSDSGAQGIAQFLPEVWSQYAPKSSSVWKPEQAIPVLGSAMCDLSGQFTALTAGDPYPLAVAAFSYGVNAVRQAGGVPQSGVMQKQNKQVLDYVDYYAKDTRLKAPVRSPSAAPSGSAKSPAPPPSPTPGKSTASPLFDPKAVYQIQNTMNGFVLDMPGDDTAVEHGVNIQQWHNQRAKDQFWRISSVGGGYVVVTNNFSNKNMAVRDGSLAGGAPLCQVDQHPGDLDQQWKLVDAGDGKVIFINRKSGMAMDIDGADNNFSDGGKVDQSPLENNPPAKDQRWVLSR